MSTESTVVKPFDFGDLPDALAQAEALWHLHALTYAYALGAGYLLLQDTPDHKAAWNLERACDYLERSVRRAYPAGEGEFLIRLARQKAREGVARQKQLQTQEDEHEQ